MAILVKEYSKKVEEINKKAKVEHAENLRKYWIKVNDVIGKHLQIRLSPELLQRPDWANYFEQHAAAGVAILGRIPSNLVYVQGRNLSNPALVQNYLIAQSKNEETKRHLIVADREIKEETELFWRKEKTIEERRQEILNRLKRPF